MSHATSIARLLPTERVAGFSASPVTREEVLYLLECARHAPSARNTQIWHFVVFTDRATIAAAARAGGHPEWSAAPVLVAAQAKEAFFKKLQPEQPFFLIDVPIAMTHLSLAASERGLAIEWMLTPDERAWIARLGLDPKRRLVAVGLLGRPAPGAGAPVTTG